ncbi:kinase-like domain-containing protein, partial [Glomus cerebriforme]
IAESSSNTSKILGVIPYVDPKIFNNPSYKLNKKSDVYSVGVLIWQISSGYQPFFTESANYACLMLSILNGKREQIIDETPIGYSKLYKECWKYEPNERPNMQEVVSTLKAMISSEQNDIIIYVNEETKNHSLERLKKSKTISKSSNEIISINGDLDINNYNLISPNNIEQSSKKISSTSNVSKRFGLQDNFKEHSIILKVISQYFRNFILNEYKIKILFTRRILSKIWIKLIYSCLIKFLHNGNNFLKKILDDINNNLTSYIVTFLLAFQAITFTTKK